MPYARSILSALSLVTTLALATTAGAQEYQYPPEAPPAPEQVVPPPSPQVVQVPVPQPQLPPQGQWVNTAEYGMVWIPAGATAYPIGGSPYAYLYTPTYGWTWYASPWGWGPCVVGAAWIQRPFPFGFRAWIHGPRGWAWHHHQAYYAPRTVYVAPRPAWGGGWGHQRYSAPPAVHHHYVAPPPRYSAPPVYVAPRPAAPVYSAPRSSGWGGGGRYGAVQAAPAPSPGRFGGVRAAPAPSPGRYGAGPVHAPSGGGSHGGGGHRYGGHRR